MKEGFTEQIKSKLKESSKMKLWKQSSYNLLKKSLWHRFSCKFCEISQYTFFTEHLRWLHLELKNLVTLKRFLQQLTYFRSMRVPWRRVTLRYKKNVLNLSFLLTIMSSIAAEHVLESLTYLVKKRKQVKKYWGKWKN